MAVFRVNKTANYTVMSNHHLKDKTLSLAAKGLLSMMLSLPDDWDYSVAGLVAICKEKETAVNTALKDLKAHGYLVVQKIMPGNTSSGRIEYIYNIFESPQEQCMENLGVEIQDLEILGVEIQDLENPGQLNTNKQNTKKINTDKSNNNNNNIIDLPESKKDIEQEFEELWKSYPRKQGKADAKKVYLRERKKDADLFQKVKKGIEAYCAYIAANKTEQKYIKHGDSWFNKKGWEDDYAVTGGAADGKSGNTDDEYGGWGKIGIFL